MDFLSQVATWVNLLENSINAYAAILHTISQFDEVLGKWLHNLGSQRRMTLVVLPNGRGNKLIRLTLLTNGLVQEVNPLIHQLTNNNTIRLGKDCYTIDGVDLNHQVWGRRSSYDDLSADEVNRYIKFIFVSPTAIMKTGEWGRYSYLLPDPIVLFWGLSKRWGQFHKLDGDYQSHIENYLSSGGCYIADLNIKTVEYRVSERIQKGFIGNVTFELKDIGGIPSRIINTLSRFAYYSGVGYQTARGMGAVQTFLWK